MARCRSTFAPPPFVDVLTEMLRYRKFPGWVKLILIRKVTDIAAIGIEEKNEPKRFEKAFKKVPKDIWHVFERPEECYDIIKAVVGKGSQ
jgi:hypothetical protein